MEWKTLSQIDAGEVIDEQSDENIKQSNPTTYSLRRTNKSTKSCHGIFRIDVYIDRKSKTII